MRASTLCFISAAALFVKVTKTIDEGLTFIASTINPTRWQITLVFPMFHTRDTEQKNQKKGRKEGGEEEREEEIGLCGLEEES